jgi:hypothetical protein
MKNLQQFEHEGKKCREFNSERTYSKEGQKIRAMVLNIEKGSKAAMIPSKINFALIDLTRGGATKHVLYDDDARGVDYQFTQDNIMNCYDRVDSQDDLTGREERQINAIFDDRQEKMDEIRNNYKMYANLETGQRVNKMIKLLTELDGPLNEKQKGTVEQFVSRASNQSLPGERETELINKIAQVVDKEGYVPFDNAAPGVKSPVNETPTPSSPRRSR